MTSELLEEVNGIKCSTTVKYLGVKVAVERKDQIRISKEQINKTSNSSSGSSRELTTTFLNG